MLFSHCMGNGCNVLRASILDYKTGKVLTHGCGWGLAFRQGCLLHLKWSDLFDPRIPKVSCLSKATEEAEIDKNLRWRAS